MTAGAAPLARSAHAAASYQNRFLLVFGGGSVANCYSDLHVLDTETMHWSQPATDGIKPTPRAGLQCSVVSTSDKLSVCQCICLNTCSCFSIQRNRCLSQQRSVRLQLSILLIYGTCIYSTEKNDLLKTVVHGV